MQQPVEQSLIAHIALSEKTRYEYIFFDKNNRLHILLPLAAGDLMARDNTCETAAELRIFVGLDGNQGILISTDRYMEDLDKDINKIMEQRAISEELEDILGKKQERISQLQQAQILLGRVIPPLKASVNQAGVSSLPELIKQDVFKTEGENCVSIILYPQHRDDYLNTEKLALFAMKRGSTTFNDSFGGKLSTKVGAQLAQYKTQQKNAKITSIEGIIAALQEKGMQTIDLSKGQASLDEVGKAIEQLLVEQGVDKEEATSLTNNLFLVFDYPAQKNKPLDVQYICSVGPVDEEEDEFKKYPIDSLLSYFLNKHEELSFQTVKPLELLLSQEQTNRLDSKFFNIKQPPSFSVAVEFFLGIANVYYYEKTGQRINFAQTLEQANGINLIKKIHTAITNNERIEPVIFAFINAENLPKLSDTDQTNIIKQFNALYNLVKDSPHMDEFFLLVLREGHYVTHQGRICIQLSEYCKQVNPQLYQEFFGGPNPQLASQALASGDSFTLPQSNKENIQIGSIPIDFTDINERSVDELVQILLTEDPTHSNKRFFHTASDAIKKKFKEHPFWINIQDNLLGSLSTGVHMMEFGVTWGLFQPLHLPPIMMHGLIAQYGMDNDLTELNGQSLTKKIDIIFSALNINTPNFKIPNEDGGLTLLFSNEPTTNNTIEQIKKICKERETTMHIYPDMARSLYETVKKKEPTVLDTLNNHSRHCHQNSLITVALKKLLPDLTVYSHPDKSPQIKNEIKQGTAISVNFYRKWGHLIEGTPDNLARIREFHYAHTCTTLSERKVYQLLYGLAQNTPLSNELTHQQKQSIRNGELLPKPNDLTLIDVKSALDTLELDYSQLQLQNDGVSYTLSMEDNSHLKKLLKEHTKVPPIFEAELIQRKLERLSKQLLYIDSRMNKIQPNAIKPASIKLSNIYQEHFPQLLKDNLDPLEAVADFELKNPDCLIDIDHEAKIISAILADKAEPELPDEYTPEPSNQNPKTLLNKIIKGYEDEIAQQSNSLTILNQNTSKLIKNIKNHVKQYKTQEKELAELQYERSSVSDPIWEQLINLKDFLHATTIDEFFKRFKKIDFEKYQHVKINLSQWAEVKVTYLNYHNEYQTWKKSIETRATQYLNSSPNLFVRFYRSWFGEYTNTMQELESIEIKFQNVIKQINQEFLNKITLPITDPILPTEKYTKIFKDILAEHKITFIVNPTQPESPTLEKAATSLSQQCKKLQESLDETKPLTLPATSPDFYSVICSQANQQNIINFIKKSIKALNEMHNLIQERTLNLDYLRDFVREIKNIIESKPYFFSSKKNTLDKTSMTCLKENIKGAKLIIDEIEQTDITLLRLMQTFMPDPATKTEYENLLETKDICLKKNLAIIEDYRKNTADWMIQQKKNIEQIVSENEKKLHQLTEEAQVLFQQFPLTKYEALKGKEKEKSDNHIERLPPSGLQLWVDIQKIYDKAKTQIEQQTLAYINYVNYDYLNDDKVTGLTRLWRAWFGTHTKNGIKRAQANAKKMCDMIEKLRPNLECNINEPDNNFRELVQQNQNQLLTLLLENLKEIHEDGSGFDQHSYTTYLISAHQNYQQALQPNTFGFWQPQKKLISDDIEGMYQKIVNRKQM